MQISIHAPREGSDPERAAFHSHTHDFYPRSPRGERRCPATPTSNSNGFLSTLPARGATRVGDRGDLHFGISIHAPREGSDAKCARLTRILFIFLSTLPARGATENLDIRPITPEISIHAPREGSDVLLCRSWAAHTISIHAPREGSDGSQNPLPGHWWYFYPRSPRGERLRLFWSAEHCGHFYPRSPRGERL